MVRLGILSIVWSVFFVICTSCNSNSSNPENSAAEGVADSTKIVSASYAAQLENVSAGESIEQLLAQGWVLENDLEVLDLSSEPTGDMPFRSFYFSKDGTFVRDPRNELRCGNWNFDGGAK